MPRPTAENFVGIDQITGIGLARTKSARPSRACSRSFGGGECGERVASEVVDSSAATSDAAPQSEKPRDHGALLGGATQI
jgi:hypothetical protein